jgi:hypothetical protein
LLLAAQESALNANDRGSSPDTNRGLVEAYFDIRLGLSFNKTPDVYGAFPTDPYSHTPEGQGAKQPGMTGMVKEEILTRLAEVGLVVEPAGLRFDPLLIRPQEFLTAPTTMRYIDVEGNEQALDLPTESFGYTFCQTPLVIQCGDQPHITVVQQDCSTQEIDGNRLPVDVCAHILARDGVIRQLTVFIPRDA